MIFKRKKAASSESIAPPEEETKLPTLTDEASIWDEPGPRSVDEVDSSVGYVDMGSLRVPVVQGMQLRTQLAEDKKTILRVLLVLGSSGLQISLAAAPRSGGVWQEVREQVAEAYRSDGATVTEAHTRYGDELIVDSPVAMPDGSSATARARIIGCEGPRWFARIDMLGPAAKDEEIASQYEKIIDRLVVVRDSQPRARLETLPLRVPQGMQETEQ